MTVSWQYGRPRGRGRRLRFLAVSLTLVVFACAGFWRATGWEAAQAGGRLSERADSPLGESVTGRLVDVDSVASTPSGPRSESLYQGKQASLRAIRLVFGARAPAAIRVASCETGGTFYARSVGRAGERGLFQIHPIHFSWAQPWRLFDPVWNSRVAYRLSRGGTRWGAWSCRWAT